MNASPAQMEEAGADIHVLSNEQGVYLVKTDTTEPPTVVAEIAKGQDHYAQPMALAWNTRMTLAAELEQLRKSLRNREVEVLALRVEIESLRRSDPEEATPQELQARYLLTKAVVQGHPTGSFSSNCISGLVDDCRCWRCLARAGLPADEETEQAAKDRAKIESQAFRDRIQRKLSQ